MLSTGHQAKGREAHTVFIIGANEGVLPHKDGELGEEARILFVMASRAAQVLKISYTKNLSCFLIEYKDRVQVYGSKTEES